MTVYLDIIFLENLIINYIILYATGIILKIQIRNLKIFFASLIGAIYSVVYYIVQFGLYSNFIVKLILSIVMIYVAFNPINFKTLVRQVLLFYLVSFVFGGATIAIIYMVNSQNITIQNGVFVGNYTMVTVLIGIAIAYIVVITAFKMVKTRISKKDLICDIEVTINGQDIRTKGMIDTGNLLKEPITNLPVVVMEYTLFYDVIPKEILNNLEKILGGDLSEIPKRIQEQYIPKLKVIPFTSLGKQNGMLLGVKAEEVIVRYNDEVKKIDKAVIGIYDKSLTKKGEYRALLGVE